MSERREFTRSGVLSAGEVALFTCPANRRAVVQSVTLVNTDVDVRLANIWVVVDRGTKRSFFPKDLELDPSYLIVETDRVFTLHPGDAVIGSADAADVVDWIISGELVTA
jgi:hypothetical protein